MKLRMKTSMVKNLLLIALILFLFVVRCLAIEGPDVLKKVDERRLIENLSFEMEITSMDGDKQIDRYTIAGFVKSDLTTNKALVYFVQPSAVKDRKMLMEGNYIWVLFPRTKNAIRLSPMQVLLGEASNGDVARTSFSTDYDVVSVTTEKRASQMCYRLNLKTKESAQGSTYGQIDLWVDKQTYLPLYADFYTDSGKLMKKVDYSDYKDYGGKTYASRLDIHDALNPTKHTVMIYHRVGTKKLPDRYFSKAYLDKFELE